MTPKPELLLWQISAEKVLQQHAPDKSPSFLHPGSSWRERTQTCREREKKKSFFFLLIFTQMRNTFLKMPKRLAFLESEKRRFLLLFEHHSGSHWKRSQLFLTWCANNPCVASTSEPRKQHNHNINLNQANPQKETSFMAGLTNFTVTFWTKVIPLTINTTNPILIVFYFSYCSNKFLPFFLSILHRPTWTAKDRARCVGRCFSLGLVSQVGG